MMGITPDSMERVFPFHFLLNMDFKLLQAGEALRRILPDLKPNASIQAIFTVRRCADARWPWA